MGSGERVPTLAYEYLIGALVIFLISLAFAWIFKTATKSQAWRRAIVWTLVSAVLTLGLTVIDAVDAGTFTWSTIDKVVRNSFGTLSFYAILLGIFLGPLVYAKFKRLQ